MVKPSKYTPNQNQFIFRTSPMGSNSTVFKILNSSNSSGSNLWKKGFISRGYYVKKEKDSLFARITHLRNPDVSVVPVVDEWVKEGKKVREAECQRIIRELRSRKRYSHALQISEWLSSKGLCPFSSGDHAVQLDLIGVVHGLDAAETYFNNLSDQGKNDKTYGALLSCYVRESLIDKSLSHMQKMKERGHASSPLPYNNIMSLYLHTGQPDKILNILSEMKKEGVTPNNFSYRICINSYGERSDYDSVDKLLEEMENQPHISMDWTTYSVVANVYIKAGLKEKALVVLKKLEEKLDKNALGYNHLITLYAHLGNKDQVMRLWGVQKVACKKQINRDYITMMGMLVKLGELEEAETLLKEWELSCHTYDFRVPNVLLIGYCQNGLIKKAEEMLENIIKTGKTPIPNSWAIIALGYLDNEDMENALKCLKEALEVRAQNPGWTPKPRLVSSILSWLGDEGVVEEVEAFVNLLKLVVPINRDMYHALIRANIRGEREVDGVLESMKSDSIDENEETERVLRLRQEKVQ